MKNVKITLTDDEIYDKVCEWCWLIGRKPPNKNDKKGIKRNLQSMKMLGIK